MYEGYKFINLFFRATLIPGILIFVWLNGLISLATVEICLLGFIFIFIVLPLIFRYSVTLQRGILFLTFITYPKGLDLSNPAGVGLYGTRSFFIHVPDIDVESETTHENNSSSRRMKSSSTVVNGVRIGVWHVLPKYIVKRFTSQLQLNKEIIDGLQNINEPHDDALSRTEAFIKAKYPSVHKTDECSFYEHLLSIPGGTVVLYLHGNTASRGSGHRLDVYEMLRNLGYHVFSFDYRGYGDSDTVAPTEEGVVRDAMAVYTYITNITDKPVIIWGHSLGTGVATNMLSQLNDMNISGPRAVILEAPFTNIRDEIRQHPFARPFKHLPWFDVTIARPMYTNSLRFESDQHISNFRQPILILHAEDDYVIPFQLGYKLYRIALDTRGKSWGPVQFHRFDASHHYGHKYICRAPELPELIKNFIETYRDTVY